MDGNKGASRLAWREAKTYAAIVEDGPFSLGFVLTEESEDRWHMSIWEQCAGMAPEARHSLSDFASREAAEERAAEIARDWQLNDFSVSWHAQLQRRQQRASA